MRSPARYDTIPTGTYHSAPTHASTGGDGDGKCDGSNDGSRVGSAVGDAVGDAEGAMEGWPDGANDGRAVGKGEGGVLQAGDIFPQPRLSAKKTRRRKRTKPIKRGGAAAAKVEPTKW